MYFWGQLCFTAECNYDLTFSEMTKGVCTLKQWQGNINSFGKLDELTEWFCFRYYFTKGKYLQLTCVYFL